MPITRLEPRLVEKIWGRRDLSPPFGPIPANGAPVGEIWFEGVGAGDDALLVKYLFTSEKLSVQVHPDEEAARIRGLPGGKEEAWWVVAAEEGATIGLGLRERVDRETLRSAALDGSIEKLLDWRSVSAGYHVYLPAGTIHALGPGLAVVEVQQNADITYRLFDYGRDRELHLEAAVAAANPGPYEAPLPGYELGPGRTVLAHGRAFVLERWTGPRSGRIDSEASVWVVPLDGSAMIGKERLDPGGVWRVEGEAGYAFDDGAHLLAAYAGGEARIGLIRD